MRDGWADRNGGCGTAVEAAGTVVDGEGALAIHHRADGAAAELLRTGQTSWRNSRHGAAMAAAEPTATEAENHRERERRKEEGTGLMTERESGCGTIKNRRLSSRTVCGKMSNYSPPPTLPKGGRII